MPVFKVAGAPAHLWVPRERLVHAESAPGGLSTRVRAILFNEQGNPAVAVFEVEGRCDVLGAAIDRGEPVEVGS